MRGTMKLMAAAAALVITSATAAPQASAAPNHATVSAIATVTLPTTTYIATTVAIQDAKIDVKIDDGSGGAWYTQPVWIAIGIVALVLIILLIVSAGRRDTTVVK